MKADRRRMAEGCVRHFYVDTQKLLIIKRCGRSFSRTRWTLWRLSYEVASSGGQ